MKAWIHLEPVERLKTLLDKGELVSCVLATFLPQHHVASRCAAEC